jgi:hypothetical protein
MRADFNKDLMRKKIKTNMDLGFSIVEIQKLLLEEQLKNSQSIMNLMARNVELADQLEFIKEEYVSQSDKIPSPAP